MVRSRLLTKFLRPARPSGKLNIAALSAAALLTAGTAFSQETPVPVAVGDESGFTSRILTTGLEYPTSLNWGADGYIWVAERSGKRVTRIHPENGTRHPVLTVDEIHVGPQHEGLLGLALHPELGAGTGNDYIYITYTYNTAAEGEAADPKSKIVRFTYDAETGQADEPFELLTGIPAWNDHNAGRLIIGPDSNLYYSNGEQGGNQGRNYQRPILAQLLPTAEEIAAEDWTSYTGKTLRIALDGSIPSDNPAIDGVQSHIFSYGHRNHQGLAFGPTGILYSSEHGPSTDDEINVIVAGGNYGWPDVSGYVDDAAYIYANWSEAPVDLRFNSREVPDEVPQHLESEFTADDHVEPIYTLFTVGNDYDFTANCGWICNPTIGPSAIAHYSAGEAGIAEWDNSLLVPTLKHGVVYLLPLSADGQTIDGEPVEYFNTQNRYRDILVGADARTFYLATDSGGTAAAKFGDAPTSSVMHNPGAIIIYTYQGE